MNNISTYIVCRVSFIIVAALVRQATSSAAWVEQLDEYTSVVDSHHLHASALAWTLGIGAVSSSGWPMDIHVEGRSA